MVENKKVTIMILVLKVDLQCEKCYRKVKKVLCKFPQIRDQTYDEKNNQVIIKVVCCSPEKIRDKLCCKGRCVIKSIDIVEPPPPEKKKEKPPPPPEKKEKPPPPPEKKEKPPPPPEKKEKPPPPPEKKEKPPPPPCTCPPVTCTCPPVPPPVKCPRPPVKCPLLPPPVSCPRPPVNTCCTECYGGHPGGPCETGYGYGVPDPYRLYDGYCGRPVYDSYSGWRSYNTSSYCSEENPQACAVM